MYKFAFHFWRAVAGLVARLLSLFKGPQPTPTEYQCIYRAMLGTMRKADTWDGRRLRVALLSQFDHLGITAAIETINPAATFIRIVKPRQPWRSVVLHYTICENDPPAFGRCHHWTALVDDFNGDAFSRSIQHGPENVADELAAFLVAA